MASVVLAVTMRQIAKLISISAEVQYDFDKTPYVTVPVDHNAAVEVDYAESLYYVTVRSWDRTGGLTDEIEVGSYLTPAQAAEGAKAKIAEIREEQEKLARDEEAQYAEQEEA